MRRFIYTSVDRDGTMAGVETVERFWADEDFIYAGGVTTADDVLRLIRSGFTGCIIGKALYEGTVDLKSLGGACELLAKRVVVALDVAGRRVVKGIRFRGGLRDAGGDPVELARHYEEQGADEVVFLDITASRESRETMVALAKAVAEVLTVPFMVGGGIGGDLVTAVNIIRSGADKVFVNTAAVRNPELLRDMARTIGSSNVVCAIDAKRAGGGGYEVFVAGGTAPTGLKLEDWARRVEDLGGAGEIMLTSIDRDGTGQGFDTGMLTAAREATSLPIIISGGARGGPWNTFSMRSGQALTRPWGGLGLPLFPLQHWRP